MIEIIPYEQTDWASIEKAHDAARMQELTLAGLADALLPLRIAAQREELFDYDLLVAKVGGEAVGFTAYTEDELAWLYVHPDYQHRGIGRMLAQAALANMTKGRKSIEVLCGNEPARALYLSLGFVDSRIIHGRMPGNEDFKVTVWELTKD